METETLIKTIIQCAYNVRAQLLSGFLENVYKNAMLIELRKHEIDVETEVPLHVYYDNKIVGEYRADMIANKSVIIELKAVNALTTMHEVQLVNYLNAVKIENGLLINFGSNKIEIRRKYRMYNKTF